MMMMMTNCHRVVTVHTAGRLQSLIPQLTTLGHGNRSADVSCRQDICIISLSSAAIFTINAHISGLTSHQSQAHVLGLEHPSGHLLKFLMVRSSRHESLTTSLNSPSRGSPSLLRADGTSSTPLLL